MVRKKGFTIVELVTVLVIVSVMSGVFYGLIDKMFESANFMMGEKESYQQGKEALKKMAEDVRYNSWGGTINHNFGVTDAGLWQTSASPCTSSRFTFFPDLLPDGPIPTRQVTFVWGAAAAGLPAANWYLRREDTVNGTTILAGVKNSAYGTLEVRYYDQNGAPITLTGGLTHAQAQTVAWIELLLTVNRWGRPVTLSETIYVRQRAPLVNFAGWI